MKIAITTWGNQVSPVFDAAQTLLIADIENQCIHSKRYESFQLDDVISLAALLTRENLSALVCAAISESYAARVAESRIRMFAFVTGNTMDLLNCLRACLIIRESKRNSMKMRTNFHKFSVNSRTIDIKFGGIGAIFMRLQPIHQLSNTL